MAVIICDIGLALFAYMDGVQEYSKLMPVVVTFGAALGAAVYKVIAFNCSRFSLKLFATNYLKN